MIISLIKMGLCINFISVNEVHKKDSYEQYLENTILEVQEETKNIFAEDNSREIVVLKHCLAVYRVYKGREKIKNEV